MLYVFRLAVLACALALSACASAPSLMRSEVAPANAELPVVDASMAALGQPDYRIGPYDLLSVTVFQIKDLDREVRVDNSGRISLPLIGTVQAAGKSTHELEDEIAARYARSYLQNPQVTLFVKEFASQRVTLNGAVKKSGMFPMSATRISLLQAVSLGEGLTETANPRNVAVVRNVNGQNMVARFDLLAIRDGQMADPVILGNDVIYIDEAKGALYFKRFTQIAPILSTWILYSNR